MKKIKSSSPESSESIFKGNNDKSSTPSADKISINDIMEAFDEISDSDDSANSYDDRSSWERINERRQELQERSQELTEQEIKTSKQRKKILENVEIRANGGSTGSDSGAHNL